jgi:hypothetical protein
MSHRITVGGLIFVALLAASCGGGDDGDGSGGSGAGAGGFSISSPEDGAEVSSKFELEFSSDDELGPTDTGANHVHVFFDGNSEEYQVVESSTFEVTGLESGEHTITASLRNADHSAAGPEDEITVTVTGAGGGGGDKKDDEGGDDGGRYDY